MTPISELVGYRMVFIGWPSNAKTVTFHFGKPHVDSALTGWYAPWGETVWRLRRPNQRDEHFNVYIPHKTSQLDPEPPDIIKNRFAYCETPIQDIAVDKDGIMFRWTTGKTQFVLWNGNGFHEKK